MQIDKLRGKELDQFFKGILALKDVEECYKFFDDVATVNEIKHSHNEWMSLGCFVKATRTNELRKKRMPQRRRFHA